MIALSAHNLALHARPGDGACFFWSGGTALGDYGLAFFNLFNLPVANGVHSIASSIWHPDAAGSAALLRQMRADRKACVDWLLQPENLYVLRSEEDLWTRPAAFMSRAYCGVNKPRDAAVSCDPTCGECERTRQKTCVLPKSQNFRPVRYQKVLCVGN